MVAWLCGTIPAIVLIRLGDFVRLVRPKNVREHFLQGLCLEKFHLIFPVSDTVISIYEV